MDLWIVNCVAVFLLCVFCAGIVIPQILLIAFRKKLFDMPDDRKIHRSAVPRLGGIAFKPVVFFSFVLVLGVNATTGCADMPGELGEHAKPLAFSFCAIMMLYLTGMADDLIGVRYRAKFIIQILCGVMLISGGIWLDDLHGVFGVHAVPEWIGWPLTVLITVFIINAINLIDGIDGLASGLCSIACLTFGVAFFSIGCHIYAMLAFATLGVLLPFYYYNVFGNPEKQKKIFMGDTGSLTIGMMLCILAFLLALNAPDEGIEVRNPLVLAFSPLLVPCCDVVRVYLHRVRAGNNPFLPDKNHIHHKLLAVGMKQRPAMVTIVLFSLALTLANYAMSRHVDVNLILVIDIAVWTVLNIALSKAIAKRKAK